MREKLADFLKNLFAGAPDTQRNRELQEEILQNNLEKFDDLVREGTPEAAAFNLVVGGLGDVSQLIQDIHRPNNQASFPAEPLSTVNNENNDKAREKISPELNQKAALLLASAVMLYILSVLPPILLSSTPLVSNVAPALMFVMIAIATGLIIYRHYLLSPKGTERKKQDDDELYGMNERDKTLYKSLSGLIWAVILVVYFVISFATHAWYITWLVFPVGGALEGVLKSILVLKRGDK